MLMMLKVKEDIPLYEQVFAVHKITKKQFYDSYHYYEAHPVAYKELVDSLESYANKQKHENTRDKHTLTSDRSIGGDRDPDQ